MRASSAVNESNFSLFFLFLLLYYQRLILLGDDSTNRVGQHREGRIHGIEGGSAAQGKLFTNIQHQSQDGHDHVKGSKD